ncbi:MAG: DUF488 domain-containing protein [Candidatus Gracilibacteria bacterium]|nr:DUF488 domain-containing protein [Candidatus Gracilibacteria bacterium]MDD4530404.1 DUF488 domain-containing protein [Candidatus Gracilibacteria bacterium]
MNNNLYTLGHGALNIEDFNIILSQNNIDILVDIRRVPFSRYYPHFNKKSFENIKSNYTYVYAGEYLGGSPEFHNDLIEYIADKGKNIIINNKLYSLIDTHLRDKIFSKDILFSNDEKRKIWITANYLDKYLDFDKNDKALNFLQDFLNFHENKNICFFCSEKNYLHCHRFHLLGNIRLKKFGLDIVHLEQKLVDIKKDMILSLF